MRILYGYRKDKQDKITRYDGLTPKDLKDNFLYFLRREKMKNMRAMFERITLVDKNERPYEDEIRHLFFYHKINPMFTNEVYRENLTYEELMFDNPEENIFYRDELEIYMMDCSKDLKDSSKYDIAYIANLDEELLEVRYGHQTKPDYTNRYGITPVNGFYPGKIDEVYSLKEKPVKIEKTKPELSEKERKDFYKTAFIQAKPKNCPFCKTPMSKFSVGYKCNGCGFFFDYTLFDKTFTDEEINTLFETGQLGPISGFDYHMDSEGKSWNLKGIRLNPEKKDIDLIF